MILRRSQLSMTVSLTDIDASPQSENAGSSENESKMPIDSEIVGV